MANIFKKIKNFIFDDEEEVIEKLDEEISKPKVEQVKINKVVEEKKQVAKDKVNIITLKETVPSNTVSDKKEVTPIRTNKIMEYTIEDEIISPLFGSNKQKTNEITSLNSDNQLIKKQDKKIDEFTVISPVFGSNMPNDVEEELINDQIIDLKSLLVNNFEYENIFNNQKKAHFIGIKGSGMAALASIYQDMGYKVSGSDISEHIFTEDILRARDIEITDFNQNNINNQDIVIAGNAFNDNNIEYQVASKNKEIKFMKYYQALSQLSYDLKGSIAIAGTHGKTSTTHFMTQLLDYSSYLIGDGHGRYNKDSEYFVFEACEYKRHFLNYIPDYAIITNIDYDHVDTYPTVDEYNFAFQQFTNLVSKVVIVRGLDAKRISLKSKTRLYTYGLSDEFDYYANNIYYNANSTSFDFYFQGKFLAHLTSNMVSEHNLENLLACLALANQLGLNLKALADRVNKLSLPNRRFMVSDFNQIKLVDDYAHHPNEIKAAINTARLKYPNQKLVLVFKPDRYSRVEKFYQDYIEVFKLADVTYITNFAACASLDADVSLPKFIDDCKAIFVSEDNEGAKKLLLEGSAIYLFVSCKNLDNLIQLVKEELKDGTSTN